MNRGKTTPVIQIAAICVVASIILGASWPLALVVLGCGVAGAFVALSIIDHRRIARTYHREHR